MDDRQAQRAIARLTEVLPAFAPLVAELAELFGDDLGVEVVFGALAEATEGILTRPGGPEQGRLEAIAAALEAVVNEPDTDPVEAVAIGFLDRLRPEAARTFDAYLLPATERLATRWRSGELDGWPG